MDTFNPFIRVGGSSPINDKYEGEKIKNALMSDKFNSLLKSCMWGNFRIDWKLFTYFKKDFWKEFI